MRTKIEKPEWDKVHELACIIVHKSSYGRSADKPTRKLKAYIGKLIIKYGRLPELVDTLASYTRDTRKAVSLMKEAYCTACELEDSLNKTMISASMLEAYLDNNYPLEPCKFWLSQFEKNIKSYTDDYYDELYLKFSARVKCIKPPESISPTTP